MEGWINSYCSSASTTPMSCNATLAKIRVTCSSKLQLRNKIMKRGEGRTEMVGAEYSLKLWEVSYTLSSTINNTLRCIFQRVGCILPVTRDRGALDIIREKGQYRCFGNDSSKIYNLIFHSLVPNCKNSSIKNEQYCCPFLFGENRRYSKSSTCTDQQGNLGRFTGQGGHWELLQNAFQDSNKDSNKRKLNPPVFQYLCKTWWTTDIDLFASTVSNQVPTYMSQKLGPYSKGKDALQMCWTHTKGYAFPHFL